VNLPFDTQRAPKVLFRVGRKPEVWTWTDPAYIGEGRWDDPEGSYRVLYSSHSAFGAYLETLAHLRPNPELRAELDAIKKNASGLRATVLAGPLPRNWRARHILGQGTPDGVKDPLVAVGKATSLAVLRDALGPVAWRLGIKEIDAGVIRVDFSAEFRRFTQAISRFIYNQTQANGASYSGIFYLGQHGDEVENYAIFERDGASPVTHLKRSQIDLDDEDFLRACRLLGIEPS